MYGKSDSLLLCIRIPTPSTLHYNIYNPNNRAFHQGLSVAGNMDALNFEFTVASWFENPNGENPNQECFGKRCFRKTRLFWEN